MAYTTHHSMRAFISIVILASLVIPSETFAMTQIIFGPQGTAASNNTTRYMGFHSGGAINTGATLANIEVPTAVSGTVSELIVKSTVAHASGETTTVDLFINGSPDADFSCTIGSSGTGCSDLVDSASISAGDLVTWRIVTNTFVVARDLFITAKFIPTTDGEALMQGMTTATIPTGATSYISLAGGTGTTTMTHASTTMPTSGTVDKLYVDLSSAPGSGKSYAFTLLKNGASTGITCTASNTNAECNDVSNSVAFSAGDSIMVEAVPSGTPSTAIAKFGLRFQPDTDGESPVFLRQSVFSNVTRYDNISGQNQRYTAEASAQASSTVSWVARNMYYVNIYGQPTGAQSRTVTLRTGGSSSALATTINSSIAWTADTADDVTVSAGTLYNYIAEVSSTPPTSALFFVSLVSYVEPPAAPPSLSTYGLYNIGKMLLNHGSLVFQ